MDQIAILESPVKHRLDVAELAEGVPELQRAATRINFNPETGGLVMVIPDHPAVRAFVKELAAVEYEPPKDLREARFLLRKASESYQSRVAFRAQDVGGDRPAFLRFVSLSSILIARADAMHWRRIVNELERAAQRKRQNERDRRPQFVEIDGERVRVRYYGRERRP